MGNDPGCQISHLESKIVSVFGLTSYDREAFALLVLLELSAVNADLSGSHLQISGHEMEN